VRLIRFGRWRSRGVASGQAGQPHLHHVVDYGGLRRPANTGGPVDPPPFRDRGIRVGVLPGRPAPALNEVAAAGGDAAQVVDVARAVTGGAGRQRLGVADVSLGHGDTSWNIGWETMCGGGEQPSVPAFFVIIPIG